MALPNEYSRFRGVIVPSTVAKELRKLTKRMRTFLVERRYARAEAVYTAMVAIAGRQQQLRTALLEVYQTEWDSVGLPK